MRKVYGGCRWNDRLNKICQEKVDSRAYLGSNFLLRVALYASILNILQQHEEGHRIKDFTGYP